MLIRDCQSLSMREEITTGQWKSAHILHRVVQSSIDDYKVSKIACVFMRQMALGYGGGGMYTYETNLKAESALPIMVRKEVRLMTKDPVCGMTVDPKTAAGKSEYQGQTYYFCSPGCKKAFDKEPQKYVASQGHGSGHGGHH